MSDDFTVTLGWIAEVCDGECHGDRDRVVSNFETDTRRTFPDQSLFFALKGRHFDGESFVKKAYELGAIAAVTTNDVEGHDHIKVQNVERALRDLAKAYREKLTGLKWIAIIGSNGKTVVKDMVADVLSRRFRTHRSPGSYNSKIGVPLSILGAKPNHEFAVLEAGISEVGEMSTLRDLVQPDAVVWTNIGDAHSAGLGGREGIIAEKRKMLDGLNGPFFFPSDATELKDLHPDAAYAVDAQEIEVLQNRIAFTVDGESFSVRAAGEHNAKNGALAVAVGKHFGVDASQISSALGGFQISDLRLQIHTTSRGITIINDTYNADPTSARAAVAALGHYAEGHRKIIVFGDMRDLGDQSETLHRQIGELIGRSDVFGLVTIGDSAKVLNDSAEGVQLRVHFDSVSEAAATIRDWVEPGDYLLVKGSRAMQLERVAELFTDSVAPARLFVDLDAIAENVDAIRREVGPDVKVMPVVKSFAYGNDSTRVAQLLSQRGVHAFVVAYPDEAIPLRDRGIDKPILVTNVFPEELDKIARYDLTAIVPREGFIEALRNFKQPVRVHLEIDTGMRRTGVPTDRALSCATELSELPHVSLDGVMTHLASSDVAAQDDFTSAQLEKFSECLRAMTGSGIDPGLVHAANTAAAWRWPDARFDGVRVGIGIYGVAPSGDVQFAEPVRFALRFVTKVIDVRSVNKGESVSYGRRWTATKDSEIATIAVGYNDGFPRFMSNGGNVLIGGVRYPVAGSVCMDATMVDVTGSDVAAGDEVVLFGTQGTEMISVDEIAERGKTISYEILTRISPRVRRIFLRR